MRKGPTVQTQEVTLPREGTQKGRVFRRLMRSHRHLTYDAFGDDGHSARARVSELKNDGVPIDNKRIGRKVGWRIDRAELCRRLQLSLFVLVCLCVFGLRAGAADSGYLFQTLSRAGATVRVKGMLSHYKLWPSMYGKAEQACAAMGGMKHHAAMFASPHDWLVLHVDPPEEGVRWNDLTEFALITADGDTLHADAVLLTDSPAEQEVFDARLRGVFLQSEGGPYGRTYRDGYVVVMVGFPEGSLQAEHGEYWAKFARPIEFDVTETGGN